MRFRRTRNPQPRGIPKVGGLLLRRSWATRAVKLKAKEGEQNARLLLSFFGGGVPRILPLALFCGRVVVIRRDASPNARRWQNARELPPNVRRRQDFAVVRSWAAIRGNFSPWCVPGRQSVAIFSLHASLKGPRTGKAPLPGNISPPCIQNELALARFARHVSEKRCKSPFGNA